jgi:MerR family transcriptional regulator/heat shock protein HspR
VELLREVQRLSQEEGVNLAGIKRVIELENQIEALQARVTELSADLAQATESLSTARNTVLASLRRDLVPVRDAALAVWKPQPRT